MNKNTLQKVKEMTQEKRLDLFKKLQQDIIQVSEEIYDFKKSVRDQKEIINYFRTIAPIDKEMIFTIYLDAKNKVIDYKSEGEGTLTQSVVYPREIIKTAIDKGALSVVLVHNHPSGSPEPSDADKKITKKLVFACKHMDMNLLDHIIIGAGDKYYSFYEQGFIERYNGDFRMIMEGC